MTRREERNGMRRIVIAVTALLGLLPLAAPAFAGESLPRIGGREAVATVNGEPVTLEELNQALGMRHAEAREGQKVGKVDYSEILNRLVNIRLILLEARNIGLDELPEVRDDIDAYARNALGETLLARQTGDVAVTDNEVDAKYRDMVKEYRLRSLLFAREEDAKRFEADLAAGGDFGTLAGKALDAGAARGSEEGAYVKAENLLPEIRDAISRMKVGSTGAAIKVDSGYAVLKLEEVRFPEDPRARARAREMLLDARKFEKTVRYVESLKKEYAQVRQDVLDGLDYDSGAAGFPALLDDRRAVAEIRGEDPVTVGELSKAIEKKFFHGIEKAVGKKAVNARKADVLDGLLAKRVVRKEALRLGIDNSADYRSMVREYEHSVLFGLFVRKVVQPGIRVEQKELKAYYDEHIADFSSPGTMKIDSLAFTRKARAKEALHELNGGADFAWVGANADGQVDKSAEDVMRFEGRPVAANSLPKGVRDAVAGAGSGQFRLYESPEGYAYVLYLREVEPATPQPLEQVAGEIARKVVAEKLRRGVEEYAATLRKTYPVKVFLEEPKP